MLMATRGLYRSLAGHSRGYLRNAYRVLLTRARQGMVIFVPPGSPTDPTRQAAYYDSTFNYLRDLGIPALMQLMPEE